METPSGQGGSTGGVPSEDASMQDFDDEEQKRLQRMDKKMQMLQSNRVKKYRERLDKLNAKVKERQSKRASDNPEVASLKATSEDVRTTSISPNVREKVKFLSEQIVESRALIAQLQAEHDIESTKTQDITGESEKPKSIVYTKDTPAEELYVILLQKEDTIKNLNDKIEKFEADSLDYKENLKVKDSVIDARTKAITLLSDNLSKQRKKDVDDLEETKQEMQLMQENFVKLEGEMRNERVKLMNKLSEKDQQITSFNETISTLKKELYELQLSSYVRKETDEAENVQQTDTTDKKVEDSSEAELTKKLEDMNKSMIKLKAQHKREVKDLRRKIDLLEKNVDVNSEISRLETENVRLEQRVAELEEEKGNLQLQIVDYDPARENSYRQEIENLKSQLSHLGKLKNDQVYSEMASLQLEEQVDTLNYQKSDLLAQIELLKDENDKLSEKINVLNKEKQEISTKLETYVQENMELIDKLEKLSAEKVSSAESIEIVESLTQQEKMEIEAFQKSIDFREVEKVSESAGSMTPRDLNESVSKLNEESSELLEKIELFTSERREVMDKMETLIAENNDIAGKLEESRMERAQLEEKYTELCHERDVLSARIEELSKENVELFGKIDELNLENKQLKDDVQSLEKRDVKTEEIILQESVDIQDIVEKHIIEPQQSEIKGVEENADEYRLTIEKQEKQISDLEQQLEENESSFTSKIDKIMLERNVLEQEILSLKNLNESLSTEYERLRDVETQLSVTQENLVECHHRITSQTEEIFMLKSIIEDNKNESFVSSETISRLKEDIVAKENDICNCHIEIERLNEVIAELNKLTERLEKENSVSVNENDIVLLTQQLEEVKQIMDQHTSLIQTYEATIEDNASTITELNSQLGLLDGRIKQTEDLLKLKDEEIEQLKQEKEENVTVITNLQQDCTNKDDKYNHLYNDLHNKYIELQNQISSNAGSIDDIKGPLEAKINELEKKNHEQLEKMKKIAANLKKKTAAYQELESKLTTVTEKWETELQEKETQLTDSQNKITSLLDQLKYLQTEMGSKTMQIDKLESENKTLRDSIQELQSLRGELENQISSLTTECDELRTIQMTCDALRAKIDEQQLYIESVETEKFELKENMTKLEETLANFKEEKLVENEDIIKRHKQVILENQDLTQTLESLNQTILNLQEHLTLKDKEIRDMEKQNQQVVAFEFENARLHESLVSLDMEMKNAVRVHERNLASTVTTLEQEMQEQLQRFDGERKALQIECQKLQDIINEHRDNQEGLNDRVIELESKLTRTKVEFDGLLEENAGLKNELEFLRQSNYDEESNIEEVEKLKNLLKDKDVEIENYQKQNLQLQMAAFASQDVADNFTIPQGPPVSVSTVLMMEADPVSEELKKTAKETVDDVISIARDRVSSLNSENSNELHKKIKTLEFLLVNAEKEKDDALFQCNKLSEELTQLIYDKQNASRIKLLDTQIFSNEFIEDTDQTRRELHNLEFTPSKEIVEHETGQHLQPVVEEPIVPQSAYLCYPDPSGSNKVESQIIKPEDIDKITAEDKRELQKQVYTPTQPVAKLRPDGTVEEIPCESKEAYLCYPDDKDKSSSVESQILSEDTLKETPKVKKELHDIEFTPLQPSKKYVDASTSMEDLIVAKDVYLCGPEDKPKGSGVEAQILEPKDVKDTPRTKEELRSIEFTPLQPQTCKGAASSVEEPITSKTAYVCYPETEDVFGEDTWNQEAQLEQIHQLNVSSSEQIADLKQRLQTLQNEKDEISGELKALQVKSAKLVKKLKEMKVTNDRLTSRLGQESNDLDVALQEELKSQVEALEKKLKEVSGEREKDRAERDALVKRVDVLTAANERMVELKERQDIEIKNWEHMNRELGAKIKQLEWGDDGFGADSSKPLEPKFEQVGDNTHVESLNAKIQELMETLNDLTLDNEEMQHLLEEQRNLRLEAEKALAAKPILENMKTESEYISLANEKANIEEKLQEVQVEKEGLLVSVKKLEQERLNFEEKLGALLKTNQELTIDFEQTANEKFSLTQQLQVFKDDFESKNQLLSQLQEENQRLEERLRQFENETFAEFEKEKCGLVQQVYLLNSEIESKNQLCEQLENDKRQLEEHLHQSQSNRTEISELEKEKQELVQQVASINALLESKCQEVLQIKEHLHRLEEEKADMQHNAKKLSEDLTDKINVLMLTEQQLQQERSIREEIVSERDRLIGESRSLHQQIEELNKSIQNHGVEPEKEKRLEVNNLQSAPTASQFPDFFSHSEIEKLQTTINELSTDLGSKEAELKILKEEIEAERTQAANLADRLEVEWAQRVDQRGNDVAELWKQHLQIRESEFETLEQQLRQQLAASVDSLNQKELIINDLEQQLQGLNETVQQRENEIASLKTEIGELEKQTIDSNKVAVDADSLNHTQTQLNELQEHLQNQIEAIKQKDDEINLLKAHIAELQQVSDHQVSEVLDQKEHLINDLEHHLQKQTDLVKQKESEAETLKTRITDLEKDCQELLTRTESLNQKELLVNVLEERLHSLNDIITQKENEVEVLRTQMGELQQEGCSFSNYLETRNQELETFQTIIESLKSEMSEKDKKNEYNKSIIEQKDNEIQSLKFELSIKEQQVTLHSNTVLEELTGQVQTLKMQIIEKESQIEQKVRECDSIVSDRLKECEALKRQLMENENKYEDLLEIKDTDIGNMKIQLEERIRRYDAIQADLQSEKNKNADLEESHKNAVSKLEHLHNEMEILNTKINDYESVIIKKDSDLENLKIQLNDLKSYYDNLIAEIEHQKQVSESQLSYKVDECNELYSKVTELNFTLDEENKKLSELSGFIESQVLKIEELKEQLYEKSNDYDALVAELDLHQTRDDRSASSGQVSLSPQQLAELDNPSNPVPKAELDLALYMLHQRDVRCEELTVELTQLLEERDTLQLKLSNALRLNEELRGKKSPDRPSSDQKSLPGPKEVIHTSGTGSKSSAILLGATGTELATEATEQMKPPESPIEKDDLTNKLLELHSVGYRKDIRLRDEQEARHLQQLSLMQQHRDVAAMLPAEAAARLVDANYTLSRDVQSPSKVLLNWLWGRSTPRVNNV